MTTKESIKAIKDYLRMSNVSNDQFNEITFVDEEAIIYGKALFYFGYDNGAMDLLTLEYDEICSLNMDELVEIFTSLYYQANCASCDGSKETYSSLDPSDESTVECECETVIYPA